MHKYLYYWNGYSNFGDKLNRILFERLFGAPFKYTTKAFKADFTAIGSMLNILMPCKSKPALLKQMFHVLYNMKSGGTVLGSGFRTKPDKIAFLKNLDFQIVRGKLSEKLLYDYKFIRNKIITGDPGLLASYMYPKNDEKKYILGIIPHFTDLNSTMFYEIYKKHMKKSIIINVQDHPDKVIRQIGECEKIISSSLHGLIVSDSLNVPNIWVENRYKLGNPEPYFKFHDYYSIFDITGMSPVGVSEFLDYDLDYIKRNYRINYDSVRAKQRELYLFLKQYFSKLFGKSLIPHQAQYT
jgi:hypothetical protein